MWGSFPRQRKTLRVRAVSHPALAYKSLIASCEARPCKLNAVNTDWKARRYSDLITHVYVTPLSSHNFMTLDSPLVFAYVATSWFHLMVGASDHRKDRNLMDVMRTIIVRFRLYSQSQIVVCRGALVALVLIGATLGMWLARSQHYAAPRREIHRRPRADEIAESNAIRLTEAEGEVVNAVLVATAFREGCDLLYIQPTTMGSCRCAGAFVVNGRVSEDSKCDAVLIGFRNDFGSRFSLLAARSIDLRGILTSDYQWQEMPSSYEITYNQLKRANAATVCMTAPVLSVDGLLACVVTCVRNSNGWFEHAVILRRSDNASVNWVILEDRTFYAGD